MQHSQPETHLDTRLTCENLSTGNPLEELSAKHPGTDPLRYLTGGTATTLLNGGHRS
ncbi:hypothetical protein B7755_007300 [Streptomyces sp. NBS 14/10]|uniref:hypothetical protein n=1 Tax=Streptomyces sp. NBS 14/10 TaxID=1945643 RepID=UPI0015C664E8|nr:hypothetical protein [Streptomyces sp. NBS 14/10]KAK1177972.1 hypothetical protein B7755_007300 [Streptomyces sp. NBS 14/10]